MKKLYMNYTNLLKTIFYPQALDLLTRSVARKTLQSRPDFF
jgi:hypothetical protein